jgi:predicted acyltransferase
MVPIPTRLRSLDAFRGLTIASMILVNNPGSWDHVYAPLRHAPWHGWTPTDLIFPFFLFIVGLAMPFSFAQRHAARAPLIALYGHILKRSLILFGLGLFLNGFPSYHLDSIRIPGVLQRIAVVYAGAAAVMLHTRQSGQLGVASLLLLGYWGLMQWVPVPGHGAGVLTPEGNLAAYIDQAVLQGHTYEPTWDPEGILSTVPAVATTLSGVWVGQLIRARPPTGARAGALLLLGAMAIALGLGWHQWFPINKNLWTSSYVVFTSGAAVLCFAVCYGLIEVCGWRRWAQPAMVYGMNALAVFVLSGLVARLTMLLQIQGMSLKTWLYERLFAALAGPLNGSLAFAVAHVLVWLGVASWLYQRRVFIKL